jgi:hypothetical protein
MALSIKRLAKLRTQIGRHGDGHGLLPPHSAAHGFCLRMARMPDKSSGFRAAGR